MYVSSGIRLLNRGVSLGLGMLDACVGWHRGSHKMFNNCACRQAAIDKIFSKESIEEIMSALVSVNTSFHLPWIPYVLGVDKPVWNICFEISPSAGYKHPCGVRTDLNNIDEFAVTGGRAQGNAGTVGEGHSEDSEEIISNRIKGDIQISMSLETQSRTLHDESHPTFFFFFPFSQNPCRESLSLSWTSCVLQPHGSFIIWLLTYSDWDFMFFQIRTARELPRSACLQREYRLTINALRGTVTDDFYEVLNLKNVVSLCLIHLIHSLIPFPSCWLMQVQDICVILETC